MRERTISRLTRQLVAEKTAERTRNRNSLMADLKSKTGRA